jgi:hypothetical protein
MAYIKRKIALPGEVDLKEAMDLSQTNYVMMMVRIMQSVQGYHASVLSWYY